MKYSCPRSCMALSHPEAGFSYRACGAGERYTIDSGVVHRLVFILEGELIVNSDEKRNCRVGASSFIMCYSAYHYELEALTPVSFMEVYFTSLGAACDISQLIHMYKQEEAFTYEFAVTPINEPMMDFLTLMRRYTDDGIECKHLHYAALQHLFIIFRFYYEPKALLEVFYNLLNDEMSFRTLVMNNCSKAKTLNELAELCGYDISAFNLLFRKHFKGVTPYAWMQQRRSHEIRRAICESTMSIGNIASQYGFSNAGHLSSFCRKFFGCTPIQLRKKEQERSEMNFKK